MIVMGSDDDDFVTENWIAAGEDADHVSPLDLTQVKLGDGRGVFGHRERLKPSLR